MIYLVIDKGKYVRLRSSFEDGDIEGEIDDYVFPGPIPDYLKWYVGSYAELVELARTKGCIEVPEKETQDD